MIFWLGARFILSHVFVRARLIPLASGSCDGDCRLKIDLKVEEDSTCPAGTKYRVKFVGADGFAFVILGDERDSTRAHEAKHACHCKTYGYDLLYGFGHTQPCFCSKARAEAVKLLMEDLGVKAYFYGQAAITKLLVDMPESTIFPWDMNYRPRLVKEIQELQQEHDELLKYLVQEMGKNDGNIHQRFKVNQQPVFLAFHGECLHSLNCGVDATVLSAKARRCKFLAS